MCWSKYFTFFLDTLPLVFVMQSDFIAVHYPFHSLGIMDIRAQTATAREQHGAAKRNFLF